jgi:DNA-binding Lrp family transcriptional regulator
MSVRIERILKRVPSDFPITERPYREIAERIGKSEKGLIDALKSLRKEGVIRRVAAILFHRRVSYTYNAMVVWKVSIRDMERVGMDMASFPEVSHCYERNKGNYWEYNLYTMIHGKSEKDCVDIVKRISESVGVRDFLVFISKREFKKTALVADVE